jgi:hypothetical protein
LNAWLISKQYDPDPDCTERKELRLIWLWVKKLPHQLYKKYTKETHTGSILLACNEGVEGITAPELAEAIAVRQAMLITRDKGFQKIILMSDCLSLIQRIVSPGMDRSVVGTMVGDIKSLATEFSTVSFKHIGRKNNVAAHLLDRSSETTLCFFSFDVLPVVIRKELCNDVC